MPRSTDACPDGELSNLWQSASFTPVVHKKQKRRQQQLAGSIQQPGTMAVASSLQQTPATTSGTAGRTATTLLPLHGYNSEGQPTAAMLHVGDSYQDAGFQSLPAAFDRDVARYASLAAAPSRPHRAPSAQQPHLTTFTSDQPPDAYAALQRQFPSKAASDTGMICSHVSAPPEQLLLPMAQECFTPDPVRDAGPGPVQRSTTMPVNFGYAQLHFRGSVPDRLQHVTDRALQQHASLQLTASDDGHVTGMRRSNLEDGTFQRPWTSRQRLESIPSLGGAGCSFLEEVQLPSLATTSMGAITSSAGQHVMLTNSPPTADGQAQHGRAAQHSMHSMQPSTTQYMNGSSSPSREQVRRQLQDFEQQDLPWSALSSLQLPPHLQLPSQSNANSNQTHQPSFTAASQPSFAGVSQPSFAAVAAGQGSPTQAGMYSNSPRHKQGSFTIAGQQAAEPKAAAHVPAQNQGSIGSIAGMGHLAAAAAAAAGTDSELQTFWQYLCGEASPAPKLPTADVVWGQTERDRVYNFLLYVPYQVERLIQFGTLLCWDSLVALFTLMPVRALAAVAQLLVGRSRTQTAAATAGTKPRTVRLAGNQVYDLLCLMIIVVVTTVLRAIRPGFIYYWLKDITSEFLKMSVLSSAFEITDKILSNFGLDVMEALSGTCTLWVAGRRSTAQLAADTAVALGITLTHALTLMCQGLVLAVALNSRRQGLLALLIANNFVEIKGAVFKRWDVPRIWGLVCQDIVERLHLWGVILFVVVEDMDSAASWRPSPTVGAKMVIAVELPQSSTRICGA